MLKETSNFSATDIPLEKATRKTDWKSILQGAGSVLQLWPTETPKTFLQVSTEQEIESAIQNDWVNVLEDIRTVTLDLREVMDQQMQKPEANAQ